MDFAQRAGIPLAILFLGSCQGVVVRHVDEDQVEAACGNGLRDVGEVCDDGNLEDGDGCSASCATVEAGYSCPPSGGECVAGAICGDGMREDFEACDDGNVGDGDGCAADCSNIEDGYTCLVDGQLCEAVPACGDGEIDAGEECDDGTAANTGAYGGCDGDCTLVGFCGDGSVDLGAGETCDDGNTADTGNGCDDACRRNDVCGDGATQSLFESCDDNNATTEACPYGVQGCTVCDDGCQAIAGATAFCGDAALDAGDGEACDEGASNNDGRYEGCNADCSLAAYCGDAALDASEGEVCDDGNRIAGDGCAANCTGIEVGYGCPEGAGGEPIGGACVYLCGNGVLGDGAQEFCDDGNSNSNDGCSALCSIETGYVCSQPGFDCEPCGDGNVDLFETCDDGNRIAGDGCNGLCQLEPGWDCGGSGCGAAECGDGYAAGVEQCDDGNRQSGDGCSFLCRREADHTCPSAGGACRLTVCGDAAIEGDETCDDGNSAPSDGCSDTCRLELGHVCLVPGSACIATVCGDGVIEGLEQCEDDNAIPASSGDGCSDTCLLEPGYVCLVVGAPCSVAVCGNGLVEGLEGCDDDNTANGDGCSSGCTVEGLYRCAGAPSDCQPVIEYVQISQFPAPMAQPQAVHYDPTTRSFVAYGYDPSQGNKEVCLDGSWRNNFVSVADCGAAGEICDRPRYGIGGTLDGASYDTFTDRFLFIQQSALVTAVDRASATVVGTVKMVGLGTAGGLSIGNDGNLYACNHFADAPGTPSPGSTEGYIRMYSRDAFEAALAGTSIQSGCTQSAGAPIELCADYIIDAPTEGPYLDNLFTIPGDTLVGYYNIPPGGSSARFSFHDYSAVQPTIQGSELVDFSSLDGRSAIPGTLFSATDKDGNAVVAFPANADGGEAAADGGYFLVCSEYLNNAGSNNGVCKLFATSCEQDSDCYNRVPGTACNLTVVNPYCHLPERARVDRFMVSKDSAATDLDVLANDSFGDGICTGDDTGVASVGTSLRGGIVAVSGSGNEVSYTPPADLCGVLDIFGYVADLGDDAQIGDASHIADVFVFIACVCGNDIVDPGEDCDDGGTSAGDGCDPSCRFEAECGNSRLDSGEMCDDGNTAPGDGCSPTCQSESVCGDGVVSGIETCDDGNTVSGDGCRSNCSLESVCGDGLVDLNEQCDDGNTDFGDGCSAICTIEAW